jgi:hypothetical protein
MINNESALQPCPFCGCSNIYEIEREDYFIGKYPQLFCNGCKMIFEVENDSPHLSDTTTYNYLREKLLNTWNKRGQR